MGLKQIIKYKKLMAGQTFSHELELPGEPMIYSVKSNIALRRHTVQFFRNKQWRSFIKCHFPSYYRTTVPVVLLIRFYVSPPSYVTVRDSDLRHEKVPAVHSYELCDYMLSFIEILMHTLINSYRQIVKFDVEKYYSSNPRTVFKFMKWDQYVDLYSDNPVHPKSKSVSKRKKRDILQPERKGDEPSTEVCEPTDGDTKCTDAERPSTCNRAPPDTSPPIAPRKKTPTAAWISSHKKTGRGQHGEISE